MRRRSRRAGAVQKPVSKSGGRQRRLHLSCDAATSPGGSWCATLDFIPGPRDVEIWGTHDVCDAPPRRMGRLRGSLNLAKIARWLADNQESYNGGDFVEDTKVRGVRGLWAELLALAWNHEDGEPRNELALALLTLDDTQLREVRRWLGPLTSPAARRRLDSVLQLDHTGLTRTTLLRLMTTPEGRKSLDALDGWVMAKEREETSQFRVELENTRRERREINTNYRRLRPEIARALERAATMPAFQNRIAALSFWLHRQVSATGRLPQGVFHVGRIQYKFNGIHDVGDVDCDALFPIEDERFSPKAGPLEEA